MFQVQVKFRDEDGAVRLGELANTFRILIEGDRQVIEVEQETPCEMDVLMFDGETLSMTRIPEMAVVEMKEVAFA